VYYSDFAFSVRSDIRLDVVITKSARRLESGNAVFDLNAMITPDAPWRGSRQRRRIDENLGYSRVIHVGALAGDSRFFS
jgi:hypothetical protein